MGVLAELEPNRVFYYFEEICGIPHGSSNTKQISDYCVAFAKNHGLRYLQDEYNNVIIWKDGSAGYENHLPVMIQGHLDMVCEKEEDVTIHFATEGISLRLQDGIISAEGTTLGGDDGIAVAYALAILEADNIPHPPLEVVLTVDEEIGMLGAAALDASSLSARTMLNLDSEEEGYLLVSCAGGVTAQGHLPIQRAPQNGCGMRLKISGLQGGHSGVEIDKGRANACQLLGRTLYELSQISLLYLLDVQGGKKDNAIPREAQALFVVPETAGNAVKTKIEAMGEIYRKEYQYTDAGIVLSVETLEKSPETHPMTLTGSKQVVGALMNLPGGVTSMSFAMDGLVQTSLNLGILQTTEEEVTFSFSVRSSVESEKKALVQKISSLMELLGGSVTCSGEYPAWEYREQSPLRDTMIEIYREQYGEEPVVQALHAGVECGLFAGKLPGLDCVSFGPDMKDIHTPKESMDVASVRRTWEYLLEILRRL